MPVSASKSFLKGTDFGAKKYNNEKTNTSKPGKQEKDHEEDDGKGEDMFGDKQVEVFPSTDR